MNISFLIHLHEFEREANHCYHRSWNITLNTNTRTPTPNTNTEHQHSNTNTRTPTLEHQRTSTLEHQHSNTNTRTQVLKVTKDSAPDLFHTLPWSHGSLGFLVGLKLRVIHVKPYVKLRYTVCKTQRGYAKLIRQLSHLTGSYCPDFVEATVFSRDQAVVMDAS